MASSAIHMAVANEINKITKRDNNKMLIGSIAPDIAKQVGESKVKSHFLDTEDTDLPNMDRFMEKYGNRMNDDFVLGYFIHLYTDYLWFKYFIPEVYNEDNNVISRIDGSVVKCDGKLLQEYVYNDYTNLNESLFSEYNMNLDAFYNVPELENIIEEVPMDKIRLITDKVIYIVENSKKNKDYVFDIKNIKKFISTCTELILAKMKEYNII